MSGKKKKEHVDKTVVTQIEKIEEPQEVKAYILFLSGPMQGKLYELDQEKTLVGRSDDVNIPITDTRVSRHHFQITLRSGEAILEDMGSTNGTYVNGHKVKKQILENGDKIQISGSTIIKFAYGDEGERMFHDEFYNMANLDAPTGIYNKQFFLKRYEEEFSFAKRAHKGMSILMCDIDFFKKVNDTYGHMAGDFVLNQIAQRIKKTVRSEDVLARYGGEEFVVILRETDEEDAYNLAERVRKNIAAKPICFENNDIQVSISIGVASLTDKGPEKPKALLSAADEMLYVSKKNGRNLVTSPKHMK